MKDAQGKQISVQNVTEGLVKLLREVRLLKSEVVSLNENLKGFKEVNPIPDPRLISGFGSDWKTKPTTDEPASAIRDIIYEYKDGDDLEVPTRTLFAIAKELDGALRDVRGARSDISSIASDSDLRADFKIWLEDQSGE
ncbi:MAG: hypothetical protein K8F25_13260 [Fimbriimonadaceae bacterium]|nr:hypothetical protein [Alphaproteobacteria bacterium]